MNNDYLVVSSGLKKKDGTPYSQVQKIIVCPTCSFLDKYTIWLDEIKEIGTMVQIKQSLV